MAVPILSYHAVNVIQNSYAENDHMALASDLRSIDALGFRVVPLSRVFDWHQGRVPDADMRQTIAITFDDGSWFDYYDLDHPTCGRQRGMLGILQDFQAQSGTRQPDLHATSFVISSPQARAELDRTGLIDKGWWSDEWWLPAQQTGLMSIDCHSWDHNHPDLQQVAQRDQIKGDFTAIDSFEDCEIQVAQAGDYIAAQLEGRRARFFAYPWGQASAYLQHQYLPEQQQRHGFEAAFNTEPRPVRKSDDRWGLPRYIFGRDWRQPGDLEVLLQTFSRQE